MTADELFGLTLILSPAGVTPATGPGRRVSLQENENGYPV